MSARNWTPGRWDCLPAGVLDDCTVEWSVVATPADSPRRRVAGRMRYNDARLIAAAPALYEALAATPCTCTTVAGASYGGWTEQVLDELCGRCAALRLAEGDNA